MALIARTHLRKPLPRLLLKLRIRRFERRQLQRPFEVHPRLLIPVAMLIEDSEIEMEQDEVGRQCYGTRQVSFCIFPAGQTHHVGSQKVPGEESFDAREFADLVVENAEGVVRPGMQRIQLQDLVGQVEHLATERCGFSRTGLNGSQAFGGQEPVQPVDSLWHDLNGS